MKVASMRMLAVALAVLGFAPDGADAFGLGRVAARSAARRMFAREAARDVATPAVALRRGTVLPRYATRREAAVEARQGLRAGQHLVGPAEDRRLLSATQARARYGLAHKQPEVREMWYVPKGTQAKVNPVWGGTHGATETTLTRSLSPRHLRQVTPLPRTGR